MTKDEMLQQVEQMKINKNYDVIQQQIKQAMQANKKFIFAIKFGYTDIYGKFEEILYPVVEMLKKDGFDITDDPDNSDYVKISW